MSTRHIKFVAAASFCAVMWLLWNPPETTRSMEDVLFYTVFGLFSFVLDCYVTASDEVLREEHRHSYLLWVLDGLLFALPFFTLILLVSAFRAFP